MYDKRSNIQNHAHINYDVIRDPTINSLFVCVDDISFLLLDIRQQAIFLPPHHMTADPHTGGHTKYECIYVHTTGILVYILYTRYTAVYVHV